MISYIKGKVLLREPGRLILNTGTLGFTVFVDFKTGMKIGGVGSTEELYTFQVVGDREMMLYGFDSLLKLETFELLIGANKVGPKTALSFLSTLPAEDLIGAILSKDKSRFGKIKGAGPKVQSQVLLDCFDKAKRLSEKYGLKFDDVAQIEEEEQPSQDDGIIVDALKNLGFTGTEIKRSIKHVTRMKGYSRFGREEVISECLKFFYKSYDS